MSNVVAVASQASAEFGRRRAMHTRLKWYQNPLTVLSLVVAAILIVIVLFIRPRPGNEWNTYGGFGGGIVALVALAVVAVGPYRIIERFENGVRVHSRNGLVFESLWHEVVVLEEQHESPDDDGFCGVTLIKSDGSKYRIYQTVTNFNKLRDAVTEGVYGILIPEALAKLEQGEAIDFSGLKVSKAGVQGMELTVPWQHVRVTYEGINMVFRRSTDGANIWSCPVSAVPNFSLLVKIWNARGMRPSDGA
jgi:hypothetical protein